MKRILNLYEEYSSIIKASDFNYRKQLEKSFQNNKKLGLKIPDFCFDKSYTDDENKFQEIVEVINNNIYCYPINDLAFNCFLASKTTQKTLGKLGIKSLITIGSYSDRSIRKKIFHESFFKIKRRLKKSENAGINLHCWLTLPNYNIIDITILSTLKMIGKYQEIDYRQFYYMNPLKQERTKDKFCYHPILVGYDYIDKINLKPKINLIEVI